MLEVGDSVMSAIQDRLNECISEVLSYEQAIINVSNIIGQGDNYNAFDASFWLSCLFIHKSKEETLEDIIAYRMKINKENKNVKRK